MSQEKTEILEGCLTDANAALMDWENRDISQQIWILEKRRVPDGEWEPCTGSVIRLRPQDFDQKMFKRESYSRYEFRAYPYRRSLQAPPPVTQGPLEAPKPPRDRGVR